MAIFYYKAPQNGEEWAIKKDPFTFDREVAVAITVEDVAIIDHGWIITVDDARLLQTTRTFFRISAIILAFQDVTIIKL